MNTVFTKDQLVAAAGAHFMNDDADEYRLDRAGAPTDPPFRLRYDPARPNGLTLTRSDWNKSTPFYTETGRLILRPVVDSEMAAFHRIADQASVARMLVNLDHPISPKDAADWLAKRQFKGRLGFMVGIYDRQHRLLGAIGLGGMSVSLVYVLGDFARGQGVASEAVHGFLAYAKARFALGSVFAGVFTDNPASRHILQKEGFIVTGTKPFQSPAREALADIWEMEWTAARVQDKL